MDTAPQPVTRRPRKRPPLRAYVPFAIFVCLCTLLLSAMAWLSLALVHAVSPSAARHPAAPTQGSGRVVAQLASPTGTPAPATATFAVPAASVAATAPAADPTPAASSSGARAATDTPLRSASLAPPTNTGTILVPLTPGGPLPTRTAVPTATPNGAATLVIARDVDPSGRPLEQAARFVSPALRLYAIATVHHLHSTDVLRFVFMRGGSVIPHDDISFIAGTDADMQPISAYADYNGGSGPLPHGAYRVLFYRNGTLEAASDFRVG